MSSGFVSNDSGLVILYQRLSINGMIYSLIRLVVTVELGSNAKGRERFFWRDVWSDI